jgi:hypothetical protein
MNDFAQNMLEVTLGMVTSENEHPDFQVFHKTGER